MYHRRKLLLGLVEAFGGRLQATDCQKLVFFYCQRTHQNHYDFFPYKYGAYSYTLQQDKMRLINLGYLNPGDIVQISKSQNFFRQLDRFTQLGVESLVDEFSKSLGQELIKNSYIEYPHYAIKSQVASKLLNPQEYSVITKYRNHDETPCLFTIGYEGITIDKYLDKLISSNVRVLVDVRRNPISQKYGFSKTQLRNYVESVEITYIHLPELGIPSHLRQHLENEQAYVDLFQHYAEELLPQQTGVLDNLRQILYTNKRVALTCFESNHQFCHRSKIVENLSSNPAFDIPILHLLRGD